jgi:hypothetical protein
LQLNLKISILKNISILFLLFSISFAVAQEKSKKEYKKRVLETAEVDFISSYYSQDGNNASVTGGIGNEHLTDVASSIVISLPLNADDVLTVEAGFSAYTSASSSNGNPFDTSGASGNGGDDDNEYDDKRAAASNTIGSPWVASSGASKSDVWTTVNVAYAHSSDSRNFTWDSHVSFSSEYDYTSFGFGGGILQQFNEKNTSVGISGSVYLDTWDPIYPTELKSYNDVNGNLNLGFFSGITILNQNGNQSTTWRPKNGFDKIQNKARNSYSGSVSFSHIINKRAQISVFADFVQQQGWLANPLQRVYFADIANYYIGNANSISNYGSKQNSDVFQLADDIERLPNTRFKIPIGMRFNYYINEMFVLRTYYRFYSDNWGITSQTASAEVPIKITDKFTLYPSFRYYTQTASNYFAPFEQHLSTQNYYTSDFDLSTYNSTQLGIGISYTDILTKSHLWKLGLKSVDVKLYQYKRNSGFNSGIINVGMKFIMD